MIKRLFEQDLVWMAQGPESRSDKVALILV